MDGVRNSLADHVSAKNEGRIVPSAWHCAVTTAFVSGRGADQPRHHRESNATESCAEAAKPAKPALCSP